jgi:geranylgeranyl diphosphate synthase, type II
MQALDLFEEHAQSWLKSINKNQSVVTEKLISSMSYSLFSGGKRFRPALGLALVEIYGAHPKTVMPWLLAIECIHTYSLIHDDLPALDNDSLRRGQPTNHVIFGEDIALLAGDALSSEAFSIIAENYYDRPELALDLIKLLSHAIGPHGMVKGQVIDLFSKCNQLSPDDILEMHNLKTGALIRSALLGSAKCIGLTPDKQKNIDQIGQWIGLAFQLKDDLLDSESEIEAGSLPAIIGLAATQNLLNQTTEKLQSALFNLTSSNNELKKLVDFNLNRAN